MKWTFAVVGGVVLLFAGIVGCRNEGRRNIAAAGVGSRPVAAAPAELESAADPEMTEDESTPEACEAADPEVTEDESTPEAPDAADPEIAELEARLEELKTEGAETVCAELQAQIDAMKAHSKARRAKIADTLASIESGESPPEDATE